MRLPPGSYGLNGVSQVGINMVMGCVSSVDFSVIINGQLGKRFKLSWGLRQGDLLSLNFFLIVTNILSCLIQVAVDG